MEEKQQEIINYLSDLDNLLDCDFFPKDDIKDFTFHHKGMNLKEFIYKGRNIIKDLIKK